MYESNNSYSFKLDGVKLRAEIDTTLSAAVWSTLVDPLPKKLLHYHPMHELFFVFDEPLSVTTTSGVREFRNTVVCIPPFTEHYSLRENDYRFLFSFDTESAGGSRFAEFLKESFAKEDVFSLCELGGEVKTYLEELCRVTADEQSSLSRELASSLLKLIFYHVWSEREEKPTPAARHESYLVTIEQIVSEYSHNPEADIDLAFVAEALHLSTKQTSRIIHKYFKKPFSALKLDKRLEYARYLIVTSDMQIAEIAAKAGFTSENYFYSTFKKKFGKTPLAYRKSAAGR